MRARKNLPSSPALSPRSRRRRLTARSVLLGGAAALLAFASCKKTASTEISLTDPDGLRAGAAWAEIVVFPDGCPSSEVIVFGKHDDAVFRKTFAATDAPPEIGTLDANSYGFSVLLKRDDCAVVGYGCTKADLKKIRDVTIKVAALTDTDGNPLDPQGACEAPLACVEGACSEPGAEGGGGEGGEAGTSGSEGGSSGSGGGKAGSGGSSGAGGGSGGSSGGKCGAMAGTGCTMQMVNKIDLPVPASKGASLGGPAIIATKTGFIAAFHELAQGAPNGRLVLVPVSVDGCTSNPSEIQFAECSSSGFDPGVGMAWNDGPSGGSGVGMVALSRQACTGQTGAGIGFFQFGAGGQFLDTGALLDNPDKAFPALYVTSQHGLSRGPAGEDFRVIYAQKDVNSQKDTAQTFGLTGYTPTSFTSVVPDTYFGGTTSAVSAYGDGVFVQALNVLDAGKPKTAVKVVPKGTSVDNGKVTALDLEASDLAIAAFGDSFALMSKTSTGAVSWGVYGSDAAAKGNGTIDGVAKDFGIDVAHLGARLVFVVGQTGGFKLVWQGDTAKMAEGTLPVGSSQVASLSAFDGKRVAVSAGNGRVAVAWISQQLAGTDPVGGVALFRCE